MLPPPYHSARLCSLNGTPQAAAVSLGVPAESVTAVRHRRAELLNEQARLVADEMRRIAGFEAAKRQRDKKARSIGCLARATCQLHLCTSASGFPVFQCCCCAVVCSVRFVCLLLICSLPCATAVHYTYSICELQIALPSLSRRTIHAVNAVALHIHQCDYQARE